jgi:rhomboid protease GluP
VEPTPNQQHDQQRPPFAEGDVVQNAPFGPPPQQPQRVMVRMPTSPVIAVWVLLGLNIFVYVVSMVLSFMAGQNDFLQPANTVLQMLGWKENGLIYQGQYWRLLTAMFLHGSLIHILFNAYALYAFGTEVERMYGTARFVTIYFVAGLVGSVASYIFSAYPSVGASGAIFGLFGAHAAFFYLNRKILGDFAKMQLQSMAGLLVINLLIGFSGSRIDNYAHIGGLIGGVIVGAALTARFSAERQLMQIILHRVFSPYGWAAAVVVLLVLLSAVRIVDPPCIAGIQGRQLIIQSCSVVIGAGST